MKQLNYKYFFIYVAFLGLLFVPSILANTHLTTVWEHNYLVKSDSDESSHLSFDLASSPDKILCVSSHYNGRFGDKTPIPEKRTQISFFEIDTKTGKQGVNLGIAVPGKIPEKPGVSEMTIDLIKKDNDVLSVFSLARFPGTIGLRKMKLHFGVFGSGFKMDDSYLQKVVDTSVKGSVLSYVKGGIYGHNLYYNSECGLLDIVFGSNGWYAIDSLITKDSLEVITVSTGNLFDDFDFGTEIVKKNVRIGFLRKVQHIDNNDHIMSASVLKIFDNGLLATPIGVMFVRFDNSGKILSKKIIIGKEYNNFYYKTLQTWYANNHIYLLCEKKENGGLKAYMRKYNLDGELVKELPFLYFNTPELSKYNRKDERYHSLLHIYITNKDELYLGGSIKDDSHPYAFYLSKYDANMNLVYEKNWAYKNSDNITKACFLRNMLIKDGYVYVKGDIFKNTLEEPFHTVDKIDNTVYVAKFKEVQSSIADFGDSIHINLYPNPCDSKSHLSLDLLNPCDLDISLCDVLGRTLSEIHTGYISSGMFSRDIDLQGLSSGVYYLKIQIDGVSQLKKLIVK